jgi:SLT domain-containing protein
MKVLKLAAGFAVGYVVGSRAGREKYEQLAAYARKTSNHPTVVQAQERAKTLLTTGTQAVVAKLPHDDAPETTSRPVRQHKPALTTPSPVGGDPLV